MMLILHFIFTCITCSFLPRQLSGAPNEELLETSYNEFEIYQDWGSLLVIV